MFIKCSEDFVRYDSIVSYSAVHNGVDVIDSNGVHHLYDSSLQQFQLLLTKNWGEV